MVSWFECRKRQRAAREQLHELLGLGELTRLAEENRAYPARQNVRAIPTVWIENWNLAGNKSGKGI